MNKPQPVAHCEHCCQCEPCVNSRVLHEALNTLVTLADALGCKKDKPDVEWARSTMDALDSERVINGGFRAASHYDELRRSTLA